MARRLSTVAGTWTHDALVEAYKFGSQVRESLHGVAAVLRYICTLYMEKQPHL